SSIMRWAQWTDGLLAHRGAPVLRGFVDPLDPQDGTPSCHRTRFTRSLHAALLAPAFARSALPRERVRSLALSVISLLRSDSVAFGCEADMRTVDRSNQRDVNDPELT